MIHPHPLRRKIEQSYTGSDLWDGDINMIPYAPTGEDCTMDQLDEFIGSQIPIETKYSPILVKVVSKKRYPTDKLVGSANPEPMLDTRCYTVKFPDGHFE